MKILDRMKDLLESKTDAELSEKLGLSLRTVGTWRSRGFVPDKVVRGWSIRYGKPMEWFTNGDDETKEADYTLVVQGIIGKVMKLGELTTRCAIAAPLRLF
jgi:hypothetical protein